MHYLFQEQCILKKKKKRKEKKAENNVTREVL